MSKWETQRSNPAMKNPLTSFVKHYTVLDKQPLNAFLYNLIPCNSN